MASVVDRFASRSTLLPASPEPDSRRLGPIEAVLDLVDLCRYIGKRFQKYAMVGQMGMDVRGRLAHREGYSTGQVQEGLRVDFRANHREERLLDIDVVVQSLVDGRPVSMGFVLVSKDGLL